MTENKRFTITQDFEEHHRQIRDNGHIIMSCFVEQQAEVIVNLLNELHDENEKLKIFLKALNEELSLANRDCDILEEENEQLKQQNEFLKKRCNEYWEEAGLNNDYLNED